MKKLLIGIMLVLTLGTQIQANAWDDFKACLKAIKSSTWDAEIGGYKDGGKVLVLGTIAAILVADQLYTDYVNKEVDVLYDQKFADYLGVSLEKYKAKDEYIPYSLIADSDLELMKKQFSDMMDIEEIANSSEYKKLYKAITVVAFNCEVARNLHDNYKTKNLLKEYNKLMDLEYTLPAECFEITFANMINGTL